MVQQLDLRAGEREKQRQVRGRKTESRSSQRRVPPRSPWRGSVCTCLSALLPAREEAQSPLAFARNSPEPCTKHLPHTHTQQKRRIVSGYFYSNTWLICRCLCIRSWGAFHSFHTQWMTLKPTGLTQLCQRGKHISEDITWNSRGLR